MSENEEKVVEMAEIPDESLEQVSGGNIFWSGSSWEVIDDKTGDVLGKFEREIDAQNFASKRGLSIEEIFEDELEAIRSGKRLEEEYRLGKILSQM